jgi:hypothetical protein
LKYTVIWQSDRHASREWVDEVFAPYISEHIYDGKRELVLDNSILVDDFVYARPLEYYARFRGKNAFLAHFQDETYELGLDVYSNFQGVFRAFWADIFNSRYIMKLPVGYTCGTRGNGITAPATQRKYLWSFLGDVNKSSRLDMARELLRVEPHFLFPTDKVPGLTVYNRTSKGPRRFSREFCAEVMSQSVFAPGPMGNVHAECYRPFEALESGTIPILEKRLTLDYYRTLLGDHPIPTVRSWAEARHLISEFAKTPARLDDLQTQCIEWWRDFKKTYTAEVGCFLAERSAGEIPAQSELVTPWGTTKTWRIIELLRHHDSRALFRRIRKQTDRLLTQGKFRVAYRRGANPAR